MGDEFRAPAALHPGEQPVPTEVPTAHLGALKNRHAAICINIYINNNAQIWNSNCRDI
jgi:hypothetical protein